MVLEFVILVMPPTKVCPECDAVVPIRLKVCRYCQHVFRVKRRIEQNFPDKAMKRLRVMLSDGVKLAFKAKDKLRKSCERSAETSEQTVHRQEQDRKRKTSMRSAETSEQTVHRQEQDRKRKTSVRSAETSEQTVHRQEQDRKRKTSVRSAETSEQTVHR